MTFVGFSQQRQHIYDRCACLSCSIRHNWTLYTYALILDSPLLSSNGFCLIFFIGNSKSPYLIIVLHWSVLGPIFCQCTLSICLLLLIRSIIRHFHFTCICFCFVMNNSLLFGSTRDIASCLRLIHNYAA